MKRKVKANRRRWAKRMHLEQPPGTENVYRFSVFTSRDFKSKGWNWQ